ncbi:peptide deformylase [Patescibacteria group bacterium]|nr:peptide deformylase [Patescibacteria group bacterium]
MIRKILTVPNPLLRQKSKAVIHVDKKIKKIIIDLLETVKNASEPAGLGLSAVQIGQPVRIFVAKTKKDFEVFINPQVVEVSKETLKKVLKKEQQFFEGCLSVPQIYGFVDRPYEIKLEWLDEKGQKHSRNFTNRDSVCLQHELDHLEGILFIDRLLKQKDSPDGEASKIYELKKDKEGKEVFEEVEL